MGYETGLGEQCVKCNNHGTGEKEQRAEKRADDFHAPDLSLLVADGKRPELFRDDVHLISRDALADQKSNGSYHHEHDALFHISPIHLGAPFGTSRCLAFRARRILLIEEHSIRTFEAEGAIRSMPPLVMA